jgi:hypothetical protein
MKIFHGQAEMHLKRLMANHSCGWPWISKTLKDHQHNLSHSLTKSEGVGSPRPFQKYYTKQVSLRSFFLFFGFPIVQ